MYYHGISILHFSSAFRSFSVLIFCALLFSSLFLPLIMLREKLKGLKQASKAYQVTPKTILRFKSDLDSETLLSIIPKTQYTSSKFVNFNRQLLTTSQERVFNKKFAEYLKNLLSYKDKEWFEHLLDFLIQTFVIENYNVNELLFVILTNKKYNEQITFLSTKVSWMKDYVWSYSYFASMLMNEVFFDFFMDYFAYYECTKEFVENVLYEFVKIGEYDNIIDRVHFMLETLKECDIELFKSIYKKLQSHIDLEPITENNTKKTSLEIVKKVKIEPEHINVLEKEILNDFSKINGQNIDEIVNIFKNMSNRDSLTDFMFAKYKKYILEHLNEGEIEKYQKHITVGDIELLLKNYSNKKLHALNKEFVKENIKVLLDKLISIPEVDITIFADHIDMEDVLKYDFDNGDTFKNIVAIAEHKKYNLSEYIVKSSIYNENTLYYLIYNYDDRALIWSQIKAQNSDYLYSCFANHLSVEQIDENLLKEMIPIYIERNISIDRIATFMQAYYSQYNFIKAFLDGIIEKDWRGEYISLHVIYLLENNQYINKLLENNNTTVLKLLCKHKNIIEYIDRDTFVANLQKLMRILLDVQNYKEKTMIDIVASFVKLFVENYEQCVDIEDDLICNITFYSALLQYFDDANIKPLVLCALDDMKQHYDVIYTVITANIERFFDVYYEIFDKIKSKTTHDPLLILNSLDCNTAISARGFVNLNSFIIFCLTSEFDILPYINNAIPFCDEKSAFTLIKKYGNMMIPYLETFICKFLESQRIQKELYKISALEVVKILVKNIDDAIIKGYFTQYLERIKKDESALVARFVIKNIAKLDDKDLLGTIMVFFAVNNIDDKVVNNIMKDKELSDICDTVYDAIQYKPSYFDPYIEQCADELIHLNCISEYFRHATKDKERVALSQALYDKFVTDIYNKKNLSCFSSVLNYLDDKEKILKVNNTLLKDIKDNEKIECFGILSILYEQVENYKQCIVSSVTYFGMFLDHKNKDIVENTKKLLEDIASFTGENPYEYF